MVNLAYFASEYSLKAAAIPGFFRIALVEEHAVSQRDRIAGANRCSALVLRVFVEARFCAKRVGRKQPIGANMPTRGKTEA